jgi:hypothetical protein
VTSDIDTIAVFDPDAEDVAWARTGPWHRQHDPEFLANGHLLIFDNLGHLGPGGASRILELDPVTLAILWSYEGDEERPFFSAWRSVQQRLPNGNTLITESDAGRVFEVTPDKEIAWEYVNPVRGKDGELAPVILGAERLDRSTLEFLRQGDPEPGSDPLESGPSPTRGG